MENGKWKMANEKSHQETQRNPVAVPIEWLVFRCLEGPRFRRTIGKNA